MSFLSSYNADNNAEYLSLTTSTTRRLGACTIRQEGKGRRQRQGLEMCLGSGMYLFFFFLSYFTYVYLQIDYIRRSTKISGHGWDKKKGPGEVGQRLFFLLFSFSFSSLSPQANSGYLDIYPLTLSSPQRRDIVMLKSLTDVLFSSLLKIQLIFML